MEKIINKLINDFTEGVDTYTHNGSTWLIFTESKQWVIELTERKTLWYNYNFFKGIFSYTSMDVVENESYITKWVDDNIINGVKNIDYWGDKRTLSVEDTIENGVRHTDIGWYQCNNVDDAIEKGVKSTVSVSKNLFWQIGDTLQNGVKETQFNSYENKSWVEGVIKGGVKETNHVDVMKFFDNKMDETIENGVKETKQKNNALLILDTSGRELILESHLVVRDGVKETSHRQFLKTYDVKDTIQDGTEHNRWILDGCNDPVDEVLDNGVKEVVSYDEHKRGPVNTFGYIDDIIKEGVRTSNPRQYVGGDIIDKVIDKGVIETHREICEYKHTVEHIIQTGVKETIECDWNIPKYVINEVISEGVKETYEDVYHHKGRIDGVIKNGVKKTMAGNYTDPSTSLLHIKWETQIEEVIDNGNKVCGTYVGGHRQEEKSESVIEYGTKNPTD